MKLSPSSMKEVDMKMLNALDIIHIKEAEKMYFSNI